MEGSLFGAVRATRLFFSAHSTRDSGEAAPGDHRLNLEGETGGGTKGVTIRLSSKEVQSVAAQLLTCI